MSINHTLRCYDYVNQPFWVVQGALRQDAARIFARATAGAGERALALNVQLRVRIGMIDVATEVKVEVGTIENTTSSSDGYSVMVIPLTWKSASNPNLFPHMQATLLVYPLSNHETQLEFEGVYDPPLGWLGDAIDAAVGHRIAEASVLRFVRDVAALLHAEAPAEPASKVGP
jgi:hypothetical protein